MGIQITERQHFVPRTYLKNFSVRHSAGHYNIKILDSIDLNPVNIEERNTKSVGYEKNIYTLDGSTAEEKMLVENFYSDEFESKYGDAYNLLIDPAKTALTEKERALIVGTVTTMLYRVPLWTKRHAEHMERVFDMALQASNATDQETMNFEGVDYVMKGKTKEQLNAEYQANTKSSKIKTQLEVALKLQSIRLQNDNIYITKLPDGDAFFITSDNPVQFQNINPSITSAFHSTNILKVPLDAKHYLMLMPNADKANLNTISRSYLQGNFALREELISNTEQLRGAQKHIFGSDQSIKRFLSIKDQPITLTPDELQFEKNLLDLGRKRGWI